MPIHALTGVRAFAAFAVMLFHFTADGRSPFAPLFARGYLGVDLFFVLSGFILQHVYRTRFANGLAADDYRKFLRFRLARIYPVHFATTVAMLALYAVAVLLLHRTPEDSAAFSPLGIVAALTLTQGWFDIASPNIPSWSVSAEWFAYLWFPFACVFFARLGDGAKTALICLSLLATSLWGNLHPLTRISPEFILGMATYDLSRRLALPRWSGLAVLGAIAVASFLPAEALGLRAGLFAAAIASISFERDFLGRFLALPMFSYLGEISYSIYLTHGVVWAAIKNMARLAHLPLSSPLLVIAAIAATVLVSSLAYHLIELPARSAIRQKAREAVAS